MVEKIRRKYNILHGIINFTRAEGYAPRKHDFRSGPYRMQGRDGNDRLIEECLNLFTPLLRNVETRFNPDGTHDGNDRYSDTGLEVTREGRIYHDNFGEMDRPVSASVFLLNIYAQLVPLQDEDPQENNEN